MVETAKKAKALAETKQQKFVRLANQRVNNAIRKIRLVANLGGSGYEGSPEQKSKIVNALASEVNKVANAFKSTGRKQEDSFTV